MAELLLLNTYSDSRGSLNVIEDFQLPFPIKRIFYIYDVNDSNRGGHQHKHTQQALVCLTGSCKVTVNEQGKDLQFHLSSPSMCLLLHPNDWHVLSSFTKGTILLVCASENYQQSDYIYNQLSNQQS